MKDVRFYLEYESKAKKRKGTRKELGDHAGNVVAIFPDDGFFSGNDYLIGAVSATFYQENSDVSSGSVSRGYLDEKCKRISEAQAREIHPKLFAYLDD